MTDASLCGGTACSAHTPAERDACRWCLAWHQCSLYKLGGDRKVSPTFLSNKKAKFAEEAGFLQGFLLKFSRNLCLQEQEVIPILLRARVQSLRSQPGDHHGTEKTAFSQEKETTGGEEKTPSPDEDAGKESRKTGGEISGCCEKTG